MTPRFMAFLYLTAYLSDSLIAKSVVDRPAGSVFELSGSLRCHREKPGRHRRLAYVYGFQCNIVSNSMSFETEEFYVI